MNFLGDKYVYRHRAYNAKKRDVLGTVVINYYRTYHSTTALKEMLSSKNYYIYS
jgi:hypothetical protein